MIEKFIVNVSRYVSSSHANVLMIYFKEMSNNELVVDLFRDKTGYLRFPQSFRDLFQPKHLAVFYKVHVEIFIYSLNFVN